jgi:type IV secretory pathway VirB10-like protein
MPEQYRVWKMALDLLQVQVDAAKLSRSSTQAPTTQKPVQPIVTNAISVTEDMVTPAIATSVAAVQKKVAESDPTLRDEAARVVELADKAKREAEERLRQTQLQQAVQAAEAARKTVSDEDRKKREEEEKKRRIEQEEIAANRKLEEARARFSEKLKKQEAERALEEQGTKTLLAAGVVVAAVAVAAGLKFFQHV